MLLATRVLRPSGVQRVAKRSKYYSPADTKPKVCVVVGLGPGISSATAKRFASEGYRVATIARTEEQLRQTHKEIQEAGHDSIFIPADVGDFEQCKEAFRRIQGELGTPSVVVYTASEVVSNPFPEITSLNVERATRSHITGALYSTQAAVREMIKSGKGSVLFVGNMLSHNGVDNFSLASMGKSGIYGLYQSLAKELGPKGVHVAHLTVDGAQYGDENKHKNLNPEAAAEALWFLHNQEKGGWTSEMDLRANNESW